MGGLRQPVGQGELLVGIDDTDNLTSRGTGYRARCLGARLSEQGLATVRGISRHQLLVDPAIPYTSHNSSLCLFLHPTGPIEAIAESCRSFLEAESADGSDAGLCVAGLKQANEAVREFGRRAQIQVLKQEDARHLAEHEGLLLEGLTGDQGGVIGALAAVGLRAMGRDGRLVWVAGIRERTGMQCSIAELLEETGVEAVETVAGDAVMDRGAYVDLGEWARPIVRNDRAVLLVEENRNDKATEWRVVERAVIKRF